MDKIVVIEDGFSTIQKTGVGQYTLILTKALKEIGYDVIYIDKSFLIRIKNKVIRRFFYNIWLNTLFLLKLKLKRKSLKVFFSNYAIPIFKIKNIKYLAVIHDLCYLKCPECEININNLYQKSNLINALKNADHIITVSQTIKNEIIEEFKYKEKNINVINNSFSFENLADTNNSSYMDEKILSKFGLTTKNYILSVATLNKRKNIPMLIDAYNKLNNADIKLVLVGGKSSQKFENTENNNNIIFTGYIDDEVLKILYKHSLVYAFPSIYEGFGIPIIDAQSFGIPVICSDINVFREIAGEGALFAQLNTDSFAKGLDKIIKDEDYRKSLILKGKINIERFDIENIKEQLKDVLSLI